MDKCFQGQSSNEDLTLGLTTGALHLGFVVQQNLTDKLWHDDDGDCGDDDDDDDEDVMYSPRVVITAV